MLDNDLAEPLLVSRGQRTDFALSPFNRGLAAHGDRARRAHLGKAPQPIVVREDALVVSSRSDLSMYATDAAPNRLTVAKRKLEDLGETPEGMTGLITFAGDARRHAANRRHGNHQNTAPCLKARHHACSWQPT